MFTSPLTWSGNIPEGIAPKKRLENRRSTQRYIPQGPSQPAGAYGSGIPIPRRTILVSARPREWPIHKPALLRPGDGSVCWGLLNVVIKII